MNNFYKNINLSKFSFQSEMSDDYLVDAINFQHYCINLLYSFIFSICHFHQEYLLNNSKYKFSQ